LSNCICPLLIFRSSSRTTFTALSPEGVSISINPSSPFLIRKPSLDSYPTQVTARRSAALNT